MADSIEIDPAELVAKVGDAVGRGIEAGLLRAGLAIEKKARDYAPVDTGSLRSSISTKKRGEGMNCCVIIGPNVKSPEGAPYDVYQEMGTGMEATVWGGGPAGGRHMIVPRRAKFLAWRSKGKGWGQVTTYAWTVGKRTRITGATYSARGETVTTETVDVIGKARETVKTTKYHGDTVFARAVRGAPAVRYMQRAIEDTDIGAEFVKGWNATN